MVEIVKENIDSRLRILKKYFRIIMANIQDYQNKLERTPNVKQIGYIRVMSKIVKDLSSGIYSSPANCIKEIINNAFDADARKVIIRARPTLNLFSITDDGIGMSLEDFQERFSVISKSYKRVNSEFSEIYKRPLIGKIGIGFIAVSEICDKLIVISKRKGDVGKFKAEINFKKFKESEDVESNDEFYVKSSYDLVYEEVPDEENKSYTKVILSELTADFKNIIQDKDNIVLDNPVSDEFEDKYFEEIVDYISNKRIRTYDELGEYWKLVFDIANTVPVEYMEDGPIELKRKDPIIESIKNDLKSYNFKVDFDGLDLKKPIQFPNQEKFEEIESYLVHSFKEEINVDGDILSFRGYLYSQHGSIYPREDNGILIRIKNTKIGEVDNSFLGYPFSTNQIFRGWVFGEIYVDKGLEDAMNIDRYSFRITHKHYRELKRFIHKYIHEIIFPHCLNDYYLKQKKVNEDLKSRKRNENIIKALKVDPKKISPKTINSNKSDLKIVDSKSNGYKQSELIGIGEQEKSIPKDVFVSKPNLSTSSTFTIEVDDKEKGYPVEINTSESKLILRSKSPVFKKFSKNDRILLEEILVLFESAYQKALKKNEDIDKLRDYFYQNLETREK